MKVRVFSFLLLFLFFAVSCDGSSIKNTKPKNDSDIISLNDTENDDSEDDNSIKPDEDNSVNAVCGDGNVEGSEVCEKNDITNCIEIDDKLYQGGKAKCLNDCTGWDTLTCDEVPMECGNNIVEGIEVCDGNTIDCHTLKPEEYESGTASCGVLCDSWDESQCVKYEPSVCGDGKVTGTEECEKETIANCVDIDAALYESGKAKCLENCTGWDTETCIEREMPDDDTVCADECFKINSVSCSYSKVMRCEFSGGCLKWIEVSDCADSSRFCADGNSIGFGTDSNERENVYKGTFIEATSNATVYEYSMELDNTDGQPLIFAVYQSDTSDGDYTVIATRTVDEPGTGKRMYSSGPIKTEGGLDLTVTAGKFYIFGVAWVNPMYSYYSSDFVSNETTFGKTLGGIALTDSYPLLSTISGSDMTLTNYNAFFNTGNTDTDICVCNNICDTKNDMRCNSNWVEECRADTYGCLDWYQEEDCGTMTCSESVSPVQCVCENECTLGYKMCDGSELLVCKEDTNNCTYWDLETDCSTSMITPYCGKDGENSAKCYEVPQGSVEYIADDADTFSNSSSAYFKGMYILANSNAVITGTKMHLQQPEGASGVDIPFMIYEGSAESGTYTRVHRSVHTVGVNGYYGPTGINIPITSGKYYFIGVYIPYNTGYYYINGTSTAIEYNLQFGISIGNESVSLSSEPGETYSFDGPYISSYRMWVESYLN